MGFARIQPQQLLTSDSDEIIFPAMSLIGSRPKSMLAVSRRVLDGADYPSCIKELVDEMALAAEVVRGEGDAILSIPESFTAEEPLRLSDPVHRAHLGGLAEFVSHLGARPGPAWAEGEDYFLSEAFFAGGPRSRSLFLVETPSAFRRRNLFCGRVATKLTGLLSV